MKQITEYCTGCRACEQLCGKKAIRLIADKEGFLTATIDENCCVDCAENVALRIVMICFMEHLFPHWLSG